MWIVIRDMPVVIYPLPCEYAITRGGDTKFRFRTFLRDRARIR